MGASVLRNRAAPVVARIAGGDAPARVGVHLHGAGLSPQGVEETGAVLLERLASELELVAALLQRPRRRRLESARLDADQIRRQILVQPPLRDRPMDGHA